MNLKMKELKINKLEVKKFKMKEEQTRVSYSIRFGGGGVGRGGNLLERHNPESCHNGQDGTYLPSLHYTLGAHKLLGGQYEATQKRK